MSRRGGDGFDGEVGTLPELREALGLRPHESVRVLSRSPRALVLERSGADAFAAFPWDRDLVLTADVRAFPLADLLQLFHAASKSGYLHFQQGEVAKSVYLHRGEVVFAASNQAVDRLGECLLRAGVITPSQYRESEERFAPPARIGKILVERGALSPRELWNGVKLQVEEIVRSLFSYAAGTVYLFEGEVRPDNVVRLSLPTRRLVAEGMHGRDELLRFVAGLEDPRVRLRAVDGAGGELRGNERAIFDFVREPDSFSSVCRRAEIDPLSAARTVQLLRLLGAVQIVRLDDKVETEGATRDDDAALRVCVNAHARILSELAAPIVAVEGTQGIRERLSRVVEEAGGKFPKLLQDLSVGEGGAIDPNELLRRARHFPGDREREVRSALGELISYLEFELLNHPKIDEPEQFLEGIESLRAEL